MSIVTSKYFDVPRLPPEFERDLAHDDFRVPPDAPPPSPTPSVPFVRY